MSYLKALPYLAALLFFFGLIEFGIHWERKDSQIALAAIRADVAAATKLASEQAQKAKAAQDARLVKVDIDNTAREVKLQVVTRTITKEVIKYVQAPEIVHVTLPAEWVRIHNAAASGTDMSETSNTAGKPDGPTSAVTDADALSVVTDNYSTCHQYADRVLALQDWAKAL